MGSFLVQTAYTPEAWARLVKNPQNREEAIRPTVEALGGRIEQCWLSFGEYDITAVVQFPDNVDAAAFSIGVSSKGFVRAFKTTPLLSMDDSLEAMRKAQKLSYAAPGG